ncbi:MAG: NAD(+)/NADH kinase [Ignavibacteriae bacterium]|nr:NAD(+)/NADH kinase [Ignavibacteriota bacterium]
MKFGIAGNPEKTELPLVVVRLIRRFKADGTPFVFHDNLASVLKKKLGRKILSNSSFVSDKKLAASCDMIISLGGDGTILRVARLVASRGTPILGVNLGKLGFLAEVSVEELDNCLTEVAQKKYALEERMMLEATLKKDKMAFTALNEIVVDKAGSSRVMDIETFVNNEYLATFTGDGVIVSTPTGSTGYALANGGPIVVPSNKAVVISPICPHTLTIRPVLVPDSCVVTLRISSAPDKIHVTADGQEGKLLSPPVEVVIRKAGYTTRLVKRHGNSYYELLRRKLHWGKDIRMRSED